MTPTDLEHLIIKLKTDQSKLARATGQTVNTVHRQLKGKLRLRGSTARLYKLLSARPELFKVLQEINEEGK